MLEIREGAKKQFSVKIVLSHTAESFYGGTLLCFTNFLVLKYFMIKKAEGVTRFSVQIIRLTVPKKLVEEPFCVSENFGYRKKLEIRKGEGITIFREICFVSEHRNFS